MANEKSVYETLSAIDCTEHVEKKNGLTYLSWAWAWSIVKKHYPLTTYTIYETPAGQCYHTDGRTAWVKTGITINDIEHVEYLPIMDYKNNSIPVEKVTSCDVNKAIQRSLTKALARHGLGLYIYAGEDIPEEPKAEAKPEPKKAEAPKAVAHQNGLSLEEATIRMREATDLYEVKTIWQTYPQYKDEKCFHDACVQRGKELKADI